jgi:hypothetical protein
MASRLPQRDAIGERAYPLDQVERLRIVKRLLDAGHRPGRVVPLPFGECSSWPSPRSTRPASTPAGLAPATCSQLVDLIRSHDVPALRPNCACWRAGVRGFVVDVVAPLNTASATPGCAGSSRSSRSTCTARLRRSCCARPGQPSPAAGHDASRAADHLPGEPHGLGLLMAEALLALEGCPACRWACRRRCWTSCWPRPRADRAHRGLGFTGCMNPKQMLDRPGPNCARSCRRRCRCGRAAARRSCNGADRRRADARPDPGRTAPLARLLESA